MLAYCIINKVNGRRYIGITAKTLARRWSRHLKESTYSRCRSAIGAAIKKYGRDAFEMRAIACASTWGDLCEVEKSLIKQEDTYNNGYNLTLGGEGANGYVFTAEDRAKLSRLCSGRTHTPETRKKMSEWMKGNKNRLGVSHVVSKEAKRKMSKAKLGILHSDSHRAKISLGLKRAWAEGRRVSSSR